MRYVTVFILLILSIGFVEAQNICGDSVPDEHCDLFANAYRNLLQKNELNIVYGLSTNLFYGAGQGRQFAVSGLGVVELDERRLESFELDALVTATAQNRYDSSLNQDTAFFAQVFLRFEENSFAFAIEDSPATEIEFDVEVLDTIALFPFIELSLAGAAEVLSVEIDGREMLHYEFVLEIPMDDAPFQPMHRLVLGEDLSLDDGSAYYTFSIMIDVELVEFVGLYYHADEFIEGEVFGQDHLVRRDTRYYIFFRESIDERYEDFDIEDEQQDEDDFFADAVESSLLDLIVSAVAEPLSEIYPPVTQDDFRGGIEIGNIIGGSEPDATATTTPTPTPTPLNTPVATAVGFPCSATIAGEEGEVLRVIHRDPTEESTIIRAARAGEEFTVINMIENDEGVWYQVRFGGSVGYVLEEHLILGEECP